jgi:hypothetical protein
MRNQYCDTYDDQNACYVGPHERFFRDGSDNRTREMHSQSQSWQISRNRNALMIFGNR